MSKISKTAAASMPKVRNTDPDKSPEELIKALRANRVASLYAPMHQVDALLAAYDARGVDLAQIESMSVDIKAELNTILDNRGEQSQRISALEELLKRATPKDYLIEGEPILGAAHRFITDLKDRLDTDAVAVGDLMRTVKHQEGELAKLGIVLNPNPGVPAQL